LKNGLRCPGGNGGIYSPGQRCTGRITKGRNASVITEIQEYKGNPVIVLKRDEDDRYPFSFGLSKAKLILEALEKIREFVEQHEG
jgi:hypothetical protein